MRTYFQRLGLALGGVIGAVAIGIPLDNYLGVPFATSYRIACALMCLAFIFKLVKDYPEESWPRIGFAASLLINVVLFFTPAMNRPASRGELMIFALPDAIVVLVALIASYKVVDVHQRAVRQQMIVGLVVALALCTILFSLIFIDPQASKGR